MARFRVVDFLRSWRRPGQKTGGGLGEARANVERRRALSSMRKALLILGCGLAVVAVSFPESWMTGSPLFVVAGALVCVVVLLGCLGAGAALYIVFGVDGFVTWASEALPFGVEPFRSAAGIPGVCLLVGFWISRLALRRNWGAEGLRKACKSVWLGALGAWIGGIVAFSSACMTGRWPPRERSSRSFGRVWRIESGDAYTVRNDGKLFRYVPSRDYWVEVREDERERALACEQEETGERPTARHPLSSESGEFRPGSSTAVAAGVAPSTSAGVESAEAAPVAEPEPRARRPGIRYVALVIVRTWRGERGMRYGKSPDGTLYWFMPTRGWLRLDEGDSEYEKALRSYR